MWLNDIAEEVGLDDKGVTKMRNTLKRDTGLYEKVIIDDEEFIELKSTADYSIDDFRKLLDATEVLAKQANIILKQPLWYGY